ncbi:hypothetical protein NQZ68_031754 [Dissostichus eleginoides]|nr:hypothetical protein NQZ68_031754 [Dissostichus eleginoides]
MVGDKSFWLRMRSKGGVRGAEEEDQEEEEEEEEEEEGEMRVDGEREWDPDADASETKEGRGERKISIYGKKTEGNCEVICGYFLPVYPPVRREDTPKERGEDAVICRDVERRGRVREGEDYATLKDGCFARNFTSKYCENAEAV